jgi:hypothetical protein
MKPYFSFTELASLRYQCTTLYAHPQAEKIVRNICACDNRMTAVELLARSSI